MVSRSVTFASPLNPTRPAPGHHPSFSLKKKTMSVTQTYFLAHKARAKLAREASRADHDLRLLVGHANLLDGLMLELADAEREQESWFNSSVRGAVAEEERPEYEDAIIEEEEEDWDSDESSSDEDSEFQDDVEMEDATHRVPAPTMEYADEEEDDEDFAELELVRTPSHSSPPELDDDEDDTDDDSMPPSPPTAALAFPAKTAKEMQGEPGPDHLFGADFYVPPRNPARLASAIPLC